MFFLAKLSQFLINPNTWLVLLLVWIYFTKNQRRKKRLAIVTVLSFILLTNGAFYKTIMQAWLPTPATLNKQYEAGILLSGMTGFDNKGNGYFGPSSDRFIQTLKLYNQGFIKKIIISGGDGSLGQNSPKEADFIYQELVNNKVPVQNIIVENQSRNTYQNAIYSKKIIDSLGLKGPFVLITSATHMPRSERLFSKAELNITPYPCNYTVVDSNIYSDDFLPNFGWVEKWGFVFKEWLGILVYKISGKA
jgi:uncharacterized SAM-binding protein YcdF (DUF218 family)